jgi:hypothetical protein
MKKFVQRINSTPAALICISMLVLIVFSQFIFSDKMLFSSDQMSSFDARVFFNESIKKFGQFPFWFSSRLGGMPSIDAMFGDVFYLPSLIVGLLTSVPKAIGYKMILHIFLAGLFFFLLLRKGFKLPPLVALTGAIFYMLNPQFLTHIYPGHDGKMYVIAWVPFIVWRYKSLSESISLKNCAFLSLGISMMLLTSHIQMSYFVLWIIGFIWVFDIVLRIINKGYIGCVKLSGFFWGAIAIALLIGLIQLLPSYMYIRNAFSVRGVDRGIDFAASWSLHWGEVFSLWVPEFVNSLDFYWGQNPFKLNSEYAGAVPLILAIFSLILSPSKWRYFWAGVALFAIAFSLGSHSFIWQICYFIVPGVSKFRAASMFMFWFSFATVLLSALFIKDLLDGKLSGLSEQSRKKWTKGILISSGGILLLSLIYSSSSFVRSAFSSEIGEKLPVFEANFTKNFLPSLWLWYIGATSVLMLILGIIHNKIKPVSVAVILLALGIFDVLRVDYQFIKLVNPAPYVTTEPALAALKQKMDHEPFRCYTVPGTLPQNSEGVHGLEGVSGFHDNEIRWYREFRGVQDMNYLSTLVKYNEQGQPYLDASQLNTGNAFLNLANVEYILVRPQNELVSIKNQNALGRISFAQNHIVIDSSKVLDAIKNGSYDYTNTVALLNEPARNPSPVNRSDISTGFTSKWISYTPNYRKVSVHTPSEGFIRISEVYYPGWKIFIDNKPAEILRSDLALMAVQIGAGDHTIEMKIDSLYLGSVKWLSISLFSALVIYLVFISITGRRKSKAN